MLGIDENIQAINFCEYYIGNDKTEVKFTLDQFLTASENGDFLMNYNTEIRRLVPKEEIGFTVVNINQLVVLSLYQNEQVTFEKKYNLADILRFLDTKQIVSNDWIVYFIKESAAEVDFVLKVSVFLSEFNKKQLLDIKLKTLLAIQNKIEQIEIERSDRRAKKRTRNGEERKKTANLVYTLMVQDPSTVTPIQKPVVEVKVKEAENCVSYTGNDCGRSEKNKTTA
jgi:hypothetical protein